MDYHCASIHPNAYIAPNATILGNVTVSEECTVLFNAVLRGDCGGHIFVGKGSNIQEGACLHVPVNGATVIGERVTVGHGAILHGCSIGDNTLIGMGAIVIDGAKVGKNCLIGAGSLVTGTANIPDGMLVIGSPARAVRALSAEEITDLTRNAEEYMEIGKDLVVNGVLEPGDRQA